MSERKRSFSSPLTMKREKCTVPRLVLRFCEIGHQRGQLLGERLGVRGALDREVNREVALAHIVFLACVLFCFANAELLIDRRSTTAIEWWPVVTCGRPAVL